MFGREQCGFFEGINIQGTIEKIIKDWRPLIGHVRKTPVINESTGERIGTALEYKASEKMQDVIRKQIMQSGTYLGKGFIKDGENHLTYNK